MPRWRSSGISNGFTALVRRYRVNAPVSEILDAVIPTVQADKHWQADRLNLYGGFAQATSTGANLLACSLASQEREVLVHKVVAWTQTNVVPVHIFTPLQGYDPHPVGTAISFPWLQGAHQTPDPANLSRAFLLSGAAPAMMTIVVNGVPHLGIGPLMRPYTAQGAFDAGTAHQSMLAGQDPPFRMHPFTMLTVQATLVTAVGTTLNFSVWYSEREEQGNVG